MTQELWQNHAPVDLCVVVIFDLEELTTILVQGEPSGLGPVWVDFDFGYSTVSLILLGLMGSWQNWLSSWSR